MRTAILVGLLSLSGILSASATPLNYIETFTASGSVTSGKTTTNFSSQPITLTFTDDSSNVAVQDDGGYYSGQITGTNGVDGVTATLGIGANSYAITDELVLTDNGYSPYASFFIEDYGNGYFYSTLSSNAFGCNPSVSSYCYTLQAPIGPLTTFTNPSTYGDLYTTVGDVSFSDVTLYSFTVTDASVAMTPEPSSLALLGTGLSGVLCLGFRRRQRGSFSLPQRCG